MSRAIRTIFATLLLAAASGVGPASAPTTVPVNIIEQSAPPTVGTEGRIDVVLPYEDLEPALATSKSDVVLRVVDRRQWGTGWRYDIRYVAAIPGDFDLGKSLRRAGAEEPPAMSAVTVSAVGVLPVEHDGTLKDVTVGRVRAWRWYWPLAIGAVVVWMLLLWPLLFWKRRREARAASAATTRVPSVAERLRPLVQSAAAGTLDADGQGRLERLLITVWRRRLSLGELSPSVALERMREHPEAGPLLRAIENWLHRRPGSHTVDAGEISRLLEPYASLPDESVASDAAPAIAGGAR